MCRHGGGLRHDGRPAQVITNVPITTDICLDSESASTNWDVSTPGTDGTKDQAFIDNPGPTPVRTVFQVPAAVFASNVTDALVTFDVASASHYSASYPVMLYPLTEAYNVATATWNTNGATSWTGGAFDTGGGVAGTFSGPAQTFTWDLSSLLANPTYAADLQNYGAILMESNDNGTTLPSGPYEGAAFRSSRYGSNAPYVAVTTVPEPSTVALLLAGAGVAAVSFGRRYRADRRQRA